MSGACTIRVSRVFHPGTTCHLDCLPGSHTISRRFCAHARSDVAIATSELTSTQKQRDPCARSQAAGAISGLVLTLHLLDDLAGFIMITVVDVILAAGFAAKPGVNTGLPVIDMQ